MFQNLLSKNYWWKYTLSLSKVIIYHEIETFTKKSIWSLKVTSFFRFLKITLTIGLWYIPPYHTICKLLERWAAWEGSTPMKESQNNNFKLKACTFFYESFFLGKLLYITRFFQRQPQENFANFLVTLQAEGVQWY